MNNIARWDPFSELNALQRRLFGDDWVTPARGVSMPTTDVYTNGDKELVVEAHLPNFNEKDIDVHVEDGGLVIQGESHEKEEDKKKKYVVRESSSSFYRRIQLPQQALQDGIEARMEDGVLRVTVPLSKQSGAKKIAIKAKGKK